VLLSIASLERLDVLREAIGALDRLPEDQRPHVAVGGAALRAGLPLPVNGARWLGPDARTAVGAVPGWLREPRGGPQRPRPPSGGRAQIPLGEGATSA
jgi:hypothetical protein